MKKILLITLCLVLTSTVAFAHWDEGDPHKMHFPQLPDPLGWDVNASILADDWQCTGTGPVYGIHFWGSWHNDIEWAIASINVSIHNDDRTGLYSKPGDLLWQRLFLPSEFTVRDWGTGDQGWYEPPDSYVEHNHTKTFQYNIEKIEDPFIQEEGKIYWLDISVATDGFWGWKTSLDHFEDDAVWWDGVMRGKSYATRCLLMSPWIWPL